MNCNQVRVGQAEAGNKHQSTLHRQVVAMYLFQQGVLLFFYSFSCLHKVHFGVLTGWHNQQSCIVTGRRSKTCCYGLIVQREGQLETNHQPSDRERSQTPLSNALVGILRKRRGCLGLLNTNRYSKYSVKSSRCTEYSKPQTLFVTGSSVVMASCFDH